MDAQISQLITLLHQSRYRCVLAVTGGGRRDRVVAVRARRLAHRA